MIQKKPLSQTELWQRQATAFLVFAFSTASVPPVLVAAEQPEIKRLLITPKHISLTSYRSSEQLVVVGIDSLGRQFDVTRECRFSDSQSQVRVDSNGRVIPVKEGKAQLRIQYENIEAKRIPLEVRNFSDDDPVRFEAETVAVLTKHGCNAGSCHGSPKGKGGFSLSLFGYDAEMDRRALLFDGFNRRINVLAPERSLILKKPMLRVNHVGGKRLRKSDPGFQVLRQWIEEGAKIDVKNPLTCVSLAISPTGNRELHFLSPAKTKDRYQPQQQLRVLATYSNGAHRNVTELAKFDTTDEKVVSVSTNGRVTAHGRGQAAITVRYLEHLTSIHFTVIEPIPGFAWRDVPEFNFVDQHVNKQLMRLRFAAAETCDDATFLRRVSLDLTGMLPDEKRAAAFLMNSDKNKRKELVNQLLKSEAYARFWSLKLADLLRVSPSRLKQGKAEFFAKWIQSAVRDGTPYNKLAETILLSKGMVLETPPALFFEAFPTTEERTETTAQVFMGTRIQCAKCHNHPFENWTQTDYYRIGAAFHNVEFANETVRIKNNGVLTHPTTNQPLQPWGKESEHATRPDQRYYFTSWLTEPRNRYFSRVAVNRIWAHLFGTGIVDPVDDFRSSNPPSNVALLDALAHEFRNNNFDQRHLLRVICNSQTYQRKTVASSDEVAEAHRYGATYPIRLLSAEQIQDAIGIVAGRLTPLSQVQTEIDRLEQQKAKRLKQLEAKVTPLRTKIDASLTSPTTWLGGWYRSPAFNHGGFAATRDREFVPPSISTFSEDGKFKELPDWELQGEWSIGDAHSLSKKNNTAHYLLTNIYVGRGQGGNLTFRGDGDDDIQIWLNGTKVSQSNSRIIQADLTLKEGRHTLLLKITNQGGDCTWQIRNVAINGTQLQAEFPGYLREAFLLPAANKSKLALAYIISQDDDLKRICRDLAQSESLTTYATQRLLPEQSDFLKAFGQPGRESPCACERSSEPTLEQALQLLNGPAVLGWVSKSYKAYSKQPDEEVIKSIYLRALSRFPTKNQLKIGTRHLKETADRNVAITDLVWAIINSQEFLFQH